MTRKNTKIDTGKLWDYVFCGSPTVAAMALAILDQLLGGKISRLKREILSEKEYDR